MVALRRVRPRRCTTLPGHSVWSAPDGEAVQGPGRRRRPHGHLLSRNTPPFFRAGVPGLNRPMGRNWAERGQKKLVYFRQTGQGRPHRGLGAAAPVRPERSGRRSTDWARPPSAAGMAAAKFAVLRTATLPSPNGPGNWDKFGPETRTSFGALRQIDTGLPSVRHAKAGRHFRGLLSIFFPAV